MCLELLQERERESAREQEGESIIYGVGHMK